MDGPQTHALALCLTDLLTGHPVDRLDIPENRWQANVLLLNCVGQVIQRVRSHGKWLIFDFSHGISWATHLLAKSAWRTHSDPATLPPSKFRPPLLALHLRNGPCVSLLGHPLFLILPTDTLFSHPHLSSLGPDPLVTPTFLADFPPRLRNAATPSLASALLDQDIVAGLTNPLKCELLFASRIHPASRVGALLASQIDHLAESIVSIATTALTAARNDHRFPYQVYDRADEPCRHCGAPIAVDRAGADGHWSWHCPTCQPPLPSAPTLFR